MCLNTVCIVILAAYLKPYFRTNFSLAFVFKVRYSPITVGDDALRSFPKPNFIVIVPRSIFFEVALLCVKIFQTWNVTTET